MALRVACAEAACAGMPPPPAHQRPRAARSGDRPDKTPLDTYKVFPARPCLPEANDGAVAGGGAASGSASSDTSGGGDRPDDAGGPVAEGGAEGTTGEGGDRADTGPDEGMPDLAGDDDEAGDDDVPNPGLKKALESYSKLFNPELMTPDDQAKLDERLQEIRERPVVETDAPHDPVEIAPGGDDIEVGPPTLTRFEKARIMGARALQLSEGAPAFIEIPESAMTSLDIAMVELDQRVIPITIRRVLPNGDFQNIPIDYFKA